MINNLESNDAARPLALHIRRLRQWDGTEPLGQGALAGLAGISQRQLRRYESSTALVAPVAALLRVALALNVPFEQLIDRDLLDELRADIEARRIQRGYKRPDIGFDGENHAS